MFYHKYNMHFRKNQDKKNKNKLFFNKIVDNIKF